MARKKKNQGPPEGHRPRGNARAKVVMTIVHTDNTFMPLRVGDNGWDLCWIGKCIHCNCKLVVEQQGGTNLVTTGATIEHIRPLCDGGEPTDPRNLALACGRCNNEKGIRHDQHAGKGGRADEVIAALQAKRQSRWREPEANS